ncbi:MAG: hypothetical protein RDU20_06885 [Desulfomonilaceae bacterium]|nr:hypothetical protein [Desulfomonilaceae bacterium]
MANEVDTSQARLCCRILGLVKTAGLVVRVLLMCSVVLWIGESLAQAQKLADSDSPEDATVQPGRESATIGSSGFTVPIPEIKMRSIIGDQPRRDPLPSAPRDEADLGEKTPSPPRPTDVTPPSAIPRSPSDAVERTPVRGPRKGPREVPAEPPKEPAPSVSEQDLPELPPAQEVTDGRQPSPPPARGPLRGPMQTERPDLPSREPEEDPHKESPPEMLTPPRAPEDAVEPPPPPRKEILKQKGDPSPPVIMKAPRSKEERKPMMLESAETDQMADPREWIQFDTRRDPVVIPPPEPEPVPETPLQPEVLPEQEPQVLPETRPAPEPKIETPMLPETRPLPEPVPVPEDGSVDPKPKESLPSEPLEEHPDAKETLPAFREPAQVREVFPSPLEEDALDSWEVMEYLRKAAPILEELSLLMTRAPSLTIADYDPSDPNAPAVPGDVHPKMDSMKRTLQILDSKAFEIIPPKKYVPFHGLIRESIAETYKACDAITAYLDSSKPEDLRGVENHLIKARELIRQTRERPHSG